LIEVWAIAESLRLAPSNLLKGFMGSVRDNPERVWGSGRLSLSDIERENGTFAMTTFSCPAASSSRVQSVRPGEGAIDPEGDQMDPPTT